MTHLFFFLHFFFVLYSGRATAKNSVSGRESLKRKNKVRPRSPGAKIIIKKNTKEHRVDAVFIVFHHRERECKKK